MAVLKDITKRELVHSRGTRPGKTQLTGIWRMSINFEFEEIYSFVFVEPDGSASLLALDFSTAFIEGHPVLALDNLAHAQGCKLNFHVLECNGKRAAIRIPVHLAPPAVVELLTACRGCIIAGSRLASRLDGILESRKVLGNVGCVDG